MSPWERLAAVTHGAPAEVAAWAHECVRKTGGRGLILSAGGGVSPGTQPEAIDALARVGGG